MTKNTASLACVLTLVIATLASSCTAQEKEPANSNTPAVNSVQISSIFVRLGIDELVSKSDAIIIGKVTEILPSRRIQSTQFNMEIICTDVIIETERYLYGEPQTERIAVQTWGGQIGDTSMSFGDSLTFQPGEEVTLFLRRLPPEETPPSGIQATDYYVLYGYEQGKYDYRGGTMIDRTGNQFTVSEIEQKITKTRSSN